MYSMLPSTKPCIIDYNILLQELFSKQKGFLEEELDYRKQALDQAYMVRSLEQYYTACFYLHINTDMLLTIVYIFTYNG